jgi:DNA-binding response OmpR family regulator
MMKQRILVVDDDKEVVSLMRAYLEQAGYEVLVAYGGESAVNNLRREKPDLLLLDLMLPDHDGRSVDLTPTEFNLLHVLLSRAGYILNRGELVSKGLGVKYEGLERTLDSHMRNLRHKIEPDSRQPTYIHTVFGDGYRLNYEEGA